MKQVMLLLVLLSNTIIGFSNTTIYVVPNGNTKHYELVKNTLENQNVNFAVIESIKVKEDQSLYIIFNIETITHALLPKHYIVYQSRNLNTCLITNDYLEKLSNAVAVWDCSFSNIEKYKNNVHNYLVFPDHTFYEYADTLMIPCRLPIAMLATYKELLNYSNAHNTDISSHLPSIFFYTVLQNPDVIVEAGVRGGESTIAFEKVLQFCNAHLLGIDIEPACNAVYKRCPHSLFVCMDDLEFGKYYKHNLQFKRKIDVIFIDTSHLYAHTLAEIKLFAPMLNKNGILMFHDSNVTPLNDNCDYLRLNGTMCHVGHYNTRGVTQAIKEYFSLSFDEAQYQNISCSVGDQNWNIIHYPYCNGLTIARKL